jgi:hypothetical protein
MRLPKLLAVCESCHEGAPEMSCYHPEEVAWAPLCRMWLCSDCWAEMENVGEEQDVTPLVFAKDALPTGEEQRERLVAAATKKRLGVK